jgi:hypothetical protein
VKTWVFIFVKELNVVKIPIILLCGNREFKRIINELAEHFEKTGGNIVLTPAIHRLPKNAKLTEEILERYKNIQKQKIEMADQLYIVNKNGEMDDGVCEEIAYARKLGGKKIFFLW